MRLRALPPRPGRTTRTTILAVSALISAAALGAERRSTPVEAVPAVDLDRYAGKWYEIARLPNRFQDDCTCCVTATYIRRDDGRLTVVNQCRTADGTAQSVEGEAKLATTDGPTSKLKVRFAPRFLSFFGFVWGDYWVLDLAEDYSHALVGDPSRDYLWILSREPTMDQKVYAGLLEKAEVMGFGVTRVEMTVQED